MEQVPKCKSLIATFKDDKLMLDGPYLIEYDAGKNKELHIKIEQCGIRTIIISSDTDIPVFDLNAVLTRIERFLMLLDGTFVPLGELRFSKSETVNESILSSYARNLEKQRLSYFSSADFCGYKINKLLSFNSILTTELFVKWEELLTELDVVHQMYLYSLSNNGVTVDVKCAFLIELAEPLVEIVKAHTNFFSSLKPGERGTTLKNCLDALITKYGVDIFKSELSNDYEKFLSATVNSRVRIMHIKREQRGVYFDGKESILYILKMSLLYRRILFEMLNIDEAAYKDNLLRCVSRLDMWNDVLETFLKRLS
ncbi:MAG: hypothetical protein K2O11_00195 [Oscillospiraceae bacterium]|nr:hypothetical protein [Oscillospiraceae bacterium]